MEIGMTGPRARVIDGMKFMWDQTEYDSVEAAESAKSGYEKDNFETRIV